MEQAQDLIERMSAVTISREYGSGGGEIAQRLAQHLNWQLIDHEIVVQTARELDISEAEAEEQDERTESIVSHLLTSMRVLYPAMFTVAPPPPPATDVQAYQDALSRVVQAALKTGHVVVVGRGSQILLKDRRDVLHVRIVADLEKRINYVMQREGLEKDDARSRIQMKDSDRARYLQAQYHHHSDDAHLYDLVLNTSVLDLDAVVDLVQLALQHKASRLSLPEGELGPGAGLPRYPGRPGDIRPPEQLRK